MTTTFIIIASIIAIPLLLALFIKKEYHVEQSLPINQSAGLVFNYVKYLKNQDYYSKWNLSDPNKKQVFTGDDGTVGFIYAWDSQVKATGAGAQEITHLAENKRLDTEIRFERPFKNVARAYIVLEPISANATKVTWGMNGKNKYPMNLMTLMMKGLLEKDMNESLQNLKRILEQ